MRGIAIERWPYVQEQQVVEWLICNYGPSTEQTWFLDRDFDLRTLVMNEKIYVMYVLRWS